MIRPRVGVAGISFVHDVPGKEEKLVETCSEELAAYLMGLGAKHYWDADKGENFSVEESLTILRQETSK